ncbi:hypothetical protein G6F42_014706 [Rhizopus arrhizus]|nr:hypothetical protein G6F42_014706 [Rhizopus arrhizus]
MAKIEDEHKWKLKSDRYVEDIMADVVIPQVYEHPVLHCILDMTDDNWTKIFSKDELKELNQVTNVEIKYSALPKDMVDFMKNMLTTSNLGEIYNHLESQQLDFYRQQHLIWVKSHVQSAIQLFKRGYLPINDQSERDICAKVWGMISDAFDDSIMTVRMEKASQASKESNNKKRKLALMDFIERQQSPLIPDMSVLFGTHEFAI